MDQRLNPEPFLAHFNLTAFRPGQREVIETVLEGQDTLCVMPTGGGKSLCYQLPAVAREGVVLVVSPLIALMKDQVDTLRALGIRASCVNSAMAAEEQREQLRALAAGELDLLYIAPERMRSVRFLETVERGGVQLLAVDEAHCISEWGHDFRPDYARLGQFRQRIGHPQTIALTATATDRVRQDLLDQLQMREPRVFVTGFARENLTFRAVETRNKEEKRERLLAILNETPGAGIVYASTRKACEEVALELSNRCPLRRVGLYHAGMAPEERRRMQDEFMSDHLDIIVATNAFGMGIDKPDLRFVIHYNLPGTLEAYYQEAGRAGRDGKPSRCQLLFSPSDRYIHEFFIENAHPPPDVVKKVYEFLCSQPQDPVEMTLEEVKAELEISVGAEGVGASEQLLEKSNAVRRLNARQNKASIWLESELPTLTELLPRDARQQRKVLLALEQIVGDRRFEQVQFPLARLEALTGLAREALTRALRELSRLDAVVYAPPFRGRGVLVQDRSRRFDQLEIDFQDVAKKRAHALEKLSRVVAYAKSNTCRQLEFLDYFGESEGTPCGRCDNCTAAAPPGAVTGQRLLDPVRMALSGVARGRGRYGKQLIALMLCGSQSSKISKLGLHKLSTFGLLRRLTVGEASGLLDELIRVRLVEQVDVDRFRPVVTLTEAGARVMRGESPIPAALRLPRRTADKLAPVARRAESTSSVVEELDSSPGSTGLPASGGERELTTADLELLDSLRQWRRDQAERLGVPAFRVLHNATLERIAAWRPRDLAGLREVPGVGDGIVERHGDSILSLLNANANATSPHPASAPAAAKPHAPAEPREVDGARRDDAPATPSQPAPAGDDRQPDWHWTWLLIERGFDLTECMAVRRLSWAQLIDDLAAAAQDGRVVNLSDAQLSELRMHQ